MKILKDRKWQIVLGAVLVVAIAVILVFVLPRDKKEDQKELEIKDDFVINEKKLIETYNMSGENAIEIIKKEYNDDNYDFSFKVSEQGQYNITVKNKLTASIDKYIVDPSTKDYYIVLDDMPITE